MTDAPPPGQPQQPSQPVQPGQPSYPPAGGATPPPYTGAPSYAAGPAGGAGYGGAPVKKTPLLSILSLVFGGVGFLFGWLVIIPFIGSVLQLFFPAAGIILGFLARSREPQAPKGLWIAGIILGAIALLVAIGAAIAWGVAVANCSDPSACTSS